MCAVSTLEKGGITTQQQRWDRAAMRHCAKQPPRHVALEKPGKSNEQTRLAGKTHHGRARPWCVWPPDGAMVYRLGRAWRRRRHAGRGAPKRGVARVARRVGSPDSRGADSVRARSALLYSPRLIVPHTPSHPVARFVGRFQPFLWHRSPLFPSFVLCPFCAFIKPSFQPPRPRHITCALYIF